jgi:hypothetical protein
MEMQHYGNFPDASRHWVTMHIMQKAFNAGIAGIGDLIGRFFRYRPRQTAEVIID